MPFDSDVVHTPASVRTALDLGALIETVEAPAADWAAERPERALAFLMAAPRACAALDVL